MLGVAVTVSKVFYFSSSQGVVLAESVPVPCSSSVVPRILSWGPIDDSCDKVLGKENFIPLSSVAILSCFVKVLDNLNTWNLTFGSLLSFSFLLVRKLEGPGITSCCSQVRLDSLLQQLALEGQSLHRAQNRALGLFHNSCLSLWEKPGGSFSIFAESKH